MREAYFHEVSSAGFWPGGGGTDMPRLLVRLPGAERLQGSAGRAGGGALRRGFGEFVLPYEAVRACGDPEQALMRFLLSTYEAAAETGEWDRGALEGTLGRPGVPRPVPIGA